MSSQVESVETISQVLAACVTAVLEGQPKCVVIAASFEDASRLSHEFVRALCEHVSFKEVGCKLTTITYDDSEIRFIGLDDYTHFISSNRGFGEFWDPQAEEVINARI